MKKMQRRGFMWALVLLLCLSAGAGATWEYEAVSVSDTSATTTFATFQTSVTLCNEGTAAVYAKLFTNVEAAGDATAGADDNFEIDPGTATVPVFCVSSDHNPRSESGQGYLAVSYVTASGTATLRIYSK